MAIPLYVPDGIGPTFDANNNQSPPPNQIHLHNQHLPNINNNNPQVPERYPRDRINFTAFPHQLITELYQLYQTHIGNYVRMERDEHPPQGAEAPLGGRDNRRDEIYLRHRLPLPDIVQCHAGLSIDLTFESTAILRNISRTSSRRSSRRRGGAHRRSSSSLSDPTPSLGNNITDDDDDDGEDQVIQEDWSLELKLLIGPWRQTGMELRAIADRFQEEYSIRYPDCVRERRCVKLRVFVNLALPAAAILGYGLAWLWNRH